MFGALMGNGAAFEVVGMKERFAPDDTGMLTP
jgi:hypothetical protein